MPTFTRAAKNAELDRKNAAMLIEFSREVGPQPVRAGATAGGDERKLRGIPAIARGVSGTMARTNPDGIAA